MDNYTEKELDIGEKDTEGIVIDKERDNNFKMVVYEANEVGRDDEKLLLYSKRWDVYKN